MDKNYIVIEKRVGETPLAALEAFRRLDPERAQAPMTYAGRLDPMAEGKLLILLGDECKRRGVYDNLDKEYEFEILFGIESDTGDVLGITRTGRIPDSVSSVAGIARSFLGEIELPYPVFSSKTIEGKPLFQYALQGETNRIQVPRAKVSVYRMRVLETRVISASDLLRDVLGKINLLQTRKNDTRLGSDFRKEPIVKRWRELLGNEHHSFFITKVRVIVSSGTYIRSLAPAIARKMETCGLAYSIKRTVIGRYRPLVGGFGFWRKKYY